MNTNDNENIDSLNDTVEEIEALDDNATQEEKDEYVQKIEDANKQLFARLQKAKGMTMVDGKWVKKPEDSKPDKPKETTESSDQGLSQKDLITIITAKIPEEDIDDVVNYAKFRNITVGEALKDNVMKTLLSDRAETRKSADATNTSVAKRGSSKVSDDALLSGAQDGKFPESDEDIKRLAGLQILKNRK